MLIAFGRLVAAKSQLALRFVDFLKPHRSLTSELSDDSQWNRKDIGQETASEKVDTTWQYKVEFLIFKIRSNHCMALILKHNTETLKFESKRGYWNLNNIAKQKMKSGLGAQKKTPRTPISNAAKCTQPTFRFK